MMSEEELIRFRESVHLPDDVPEHLVSDILDILNRVSFGWGKWISHSAGWYPIIIFLNRNLAALDPGYSVHQVKEKFGGLRYYFGVSELPQLPCCDEFDSIHPRPVRRSWPTDDPKVDYYGVEFAIWAAAHEDHWNTPEHVAAFDAQEPAREARHELFERMLDIADAAERLSEVTCELCGGNGELCLRRGWWKTLCPSCASEHGYEPYGKEEDD